ncbi:hypothetical protein BS47DRAFT_1401701 [Hydnum rufescens UP504]|uniref:Uncharacterized protein n=1 Tax=Hydnum rufescens UP504 TaxID=1448309 RepID=A0A9P6DHX6_9AGAM|nr:hypothetical protein BS47DRAFT_1401701 [Hydnum rufescens UP504]
MPSTPAEIPPSVKSPVVAPTSPPPTPAEIPPSTNTKSPVSPTSAAPLRMNCGLEPLLRSRMLRALR